MIAKCFNLHNMVNLEQNDVHQDSLQAALGSYNTTNKSRMRATKPKNDKGRGRNKLKFSKNPVLVDVNGNLQPISASSWQMSTLIGVLARNPQKLPLDCFDYKKNRTTEGFVMAKGESMCAYGINFALI